MESFEELACSVTDDLFASAAIETSPPVAAVMSASSALRSHRRDGKSRRAIVNRECSRFIAPLRVQVCGAVTTRHSFASNQERDRQCASDSEDDDEDGGKESRNNASQLANKVQIRRRNAAMIADALQTVLTLVVPRPVDSTAASSGDLSLPRARAELGAMTRASACSSGAALIQGLGAATNSGRRPTFSDPEARIHYIHHYARQRCLAFSAALADPVSNFYLTSLLCYPTLEASIKHEAGRIDSSVVDDDAVRIVSIGGGPGFDFIALSLAGVHLRALLDYREHMHPSTGLSATDCCMPNSIDGMASTTKAVARVRPLHARIMDNEEGWRSHVEEIAARCANVRAPPVPACSGAASAALSDSAADAAIVPPPPWAKSRLVFEWGDISSTAMVDGAHGLHTLQTTDMYCFQSVCLENAVLLRSCRFGLVRAILRGARVGAIVYVADSSDVLFPELCAVAGEENAVRAVGAWRFHVPKIRKMQKTPNALLLVCEE